MGVSNAGLGDALAGAGVGDALLAGIAVLLLVARGRLFAPQPANPSRATPPATSTSRRVQFRFSASKPSIFFMESFYHRQTTTKDYWAILVFYGIMSAQAHIPS